MADFETVAEPLLRGSQLPYLCQWVPRPQILTATFVQWMIQHFSTESNIEQSPLLSKLWKSDIRENGILITTDKAFKPSETEKRPAIVVKRNAWKRLRLGIDDRKMMAVGEDGNRYYAGFWQGSHTLFAIAGDGAEAEMLGSEVQRELEGFSPVVRQLVRLHRLEVLEMGEAHKLEEARENYAIPITIAYAWEHNWSIFEPGTALLNDLTLTLNS